MGRRTKAQINHDEYCDDVDNYKWFVWDRATNRIRAGFEHKEDAMEVLADYDFAKVVSKGGLKKLGFNIEQIKTEWKTM